MWATGWRSAWPKRLPRLATPPSCIEIEYEPLPSVVDLSAAVAAGAPSVWGAVPTNICFTLKMGDVVAARNAFAAASHHVRLRLVNNRVTAGSMEPRGAIGIHNPADQSFVLYSSTQNPHRVRETLAQFVFRIPESMLRVIGSDVGGGFGMKGDTYPEESIVLVASQLLRRPVKWISSRSDAFILDNAGRDQLIDAEMAFDREGHILAIRAKALHNLGAYMVGAALVPLVFSLKLIPNVYRVPTVDLSTQGVFTHTAPTNPYRGAGRPEAIYATERLLDLAATELGIDPFEIRRRNFIDKTALPYRSPTGLTYDSGDFRAAAETCVALADWAGCAARRDSQCTSRQAARTSDRLVHRGHRRVQRPDGIALRSVRRGDDRRRHVFARPVARHHLQPMRLRLAGNSARSNPISSRATRPGVLRPRHLCVGQRHHRRQCVAIGGRRGH